VTIRVPEPREGVVHPLARNFPKLRKRRERLRAPAGTRNRAAVLTIVRNEPVFLPIWLDYYSRFFGPDDIYVLDHETDDGSTDRDGFVRIPVSHDTVDHTWMVRTIEQHQHALLEEYDVVVVCDVDEIIAPRPEWGTLGEYVGRLREPFVNCWGYEVVHLADREPPYDPAQKVSDQRSYWFQNPIYDKPVVATEPMEWVPGFHTTADQERRFDPDLFLIHLHRMDFGLCLERHRFRQTRAWNDRDVELGWARHNRITGEEDFAGWFYEDSSMSITEVVVEHIPPAWRGVF
jgi:hypothetical protein